MNDFTKEELEFLKNSVREHYKNNPPIKGFYQGSINIGIYCNKCLKKLKGS